MHNQKVILYLTHIMSFINYKLDMKYKSIIVSIIGSFALIIVAFIFRDAYKFKFNQINTISVTGNAKTDFEADIVRWSAHYSRKSLNMSSASVKLSEDKALIKHFLLQQGISESEIQFGPITIMKEYDYEYNSNGNSNRTFSGYKLTQKISVESRSLDKVDNASRETSALISKGVELSSYEPNYYYSNLEDLKLKLISSASENARQRAENIAEKSGIELGKLVKADLGVFQITGQNKNEEYSYGGVYNTTSRYKTANITVKTLYSSRFR